MNIEFTIRCHANWLLLLLLFLLKMHILSILRMTIISVWTKILHCVIVVTLHSFLLCAMCMPIQTQHLIKHILFSHSIEMAGGDEIISMILGADILSFHVRFHFSSKHRNEIDWCNSSIHSFIHPFNRLATRVEIFWSARAQNVIKMCRCGHFQTRQATWLSIGIVQMKIGSTQTHREFWYLVYCWIVQQA